MYFDNILGLYLLGFLIPLIILYLIKAKPKEVVIPSLIFFSREAKVKKYNAILKKLLVRTLFFIQLLFILLIALSASNPVITVPMDAYSLNTVVIMDVSASMNTKDTTISRMDAGKSDLLKLVRGKVSIILAEENPVVIASNVSASRARALITSLEAKDTPTRIDGAILFANDLIGNDRGTIIVYSDFMLDKDDDIIAAKKIAEANEKRIVTLKTGKSQENLGFITLNIARGKGEAFIKNFGDKDKVTDVKFKSSSKTKSKRITIPSGSVEKVSFDISQGENILELGQKDRMRVDDYLYVLNPYERKIDILLITNDNNKNYLLNALEANLEFNVQVAKPPVIPDLNHDVVVVSNVDKSLLLPNTFRDIKRYKDNGGKVILAGQPDIDKFDFQNLIYFRFGKQKIGSKEVCVDAINEFTSMLNPRCFTSTTRYYETSVTDNSSVVLASTDSGNPILIFEDNLLYYGIIDTYSGFRDQISYPLFWDNVINQMLGRESLANFNYKTGDVLLASNTSKAMLDKAGFFDVNNKKVAVNLIDPDESNIFTQVEVDTSEFETEYEKIDLDVDLGDFLLVLAILVFIFELYYIKRRGDL
jgi:hypothetical protein